MVERQQKNEKKEQKSKKSIKLKISKRKRK